VTLGKAGITVVFLTFRKVDGFFRGKKYDLAEKNVS